jgi:hypothetical protein
MCIDRLETAPGSASRRREGPPESAPVLVPAVAPNEAVVFTVCPTFDEEAGLLVPWGGTTGRAGTPSSRSPSFTDMSSSSIRGASGGLSSGVARTCTDAVAPFGMTVPSPASTSCFTTALRFFPANRLSILTDSRRRTRIDVPLGPKGPSIPGGWTRSGAPAVFSGLGYEHGETHRNPLVLKGIMSPATAYRHESSRTVGLR